MLVAFFALAAALVGASLALADGTDPTEPISPAAGSEEAADSAATVEPAPTDPEAAEELPHHSLGREEAGELLEGVFEPEVQGPAGIYSDLHVEKFLAPNVAVIAAGEQPETPGEEEEAEILEGSQDAEATLVDSTVPLATEGASGHLEAVDLNLKRSEGFLVPDNSPLELEIPVELGEGIGLPGPGIRIELEGMAEATAASTIDGTVAFYPNVSSETDLAVSPTVGGVETMTQLRTPESPRIETYRLDLPPGASLEAKGGGAVVTRGEETLMTVAPPTALDAEGRSVPTELSVEGDLLRIEVSPPQTTDYPVLVDPLFQSFEWAAKDYTDYYNQGFGEGWKLELPRTNWAGGQAGSEVGTNYRMDALVPFGSLGLDIWHTGSMTAGEEEFWVYRVPRYESDLKERGALPETFISRMTTSDVAWRAEGGEVNPYVTMGLWGPSKGWASLYTHEGNAGHSVDNLGFVYPFPNELSVPDVKEAKVGMWAGGEAKYANDELFVGAATIELSEPAASAPSINSIYGPTEWVRSGTAAVHFSVADHGLGLLTATVGASENAGAKIWKASKECTGVAYSPCPSQWSGEIAVEAESLPTGIDRLPVTFEDPLGHATVGHVEVAVDHQAPQVTLSGSIAEQANLGTALPNYTLHASAIDGVAAYPQSGVAKMTIKVDGTVVDESSPGCPTENCSVSREWTLSSEKYASGPHQVEVTAVDAVGNAYTKTLWIQLRTTSAPTVSVSGSLTEQSTLGDSRPRYSLAVASSTAAQPETSPKNPPAFVSSFGSSGTGPGQFSTAGGVAVAPSGRLWVADPSDGRVEAFNPKGEYLFQFGSPGSGEGQLSGAANLAVDSSGDVWVADTGNNRVEEFSEAGKLIRQFGSKGSASDQFNVPEGLVIDGNGNLWVCDRLNNRLDEFNPKGEFLKSAGPIGQPIGLAIDPAGELWVVGASGGGVRVYSEGGALLRPTIGQIGSGAGELLAPGAVTIDPAGHVWIAERSYDKVYEFKEGGGYLGQFGAKGSGAGQFAFTKPTEIAADGSGYLWVSDPGNNRVQKWQVGLAPGSNSTEVLMDGKRVASASANCMNEVCPAATNWTLESSSYAAGPHTVTVRSTDGDGRSTTETLPIEIQRDTTAPRVEVGGELADAPEGWVQQESYGFHATATDGGYGVTSLVLKIDGQTVAHEEQGCPDGGCGLSLSSQIEMGSYSGGAHEAEVIATDGAGNRNVNSWTINVDPEGRITTQEEKETLEAVELTSEQTPVAPTYQLVEPEQREGGDDPGLKVSGSEIASTGVPDVTTMTTDPEDGFSIESPEGTTTITPVMSETSSNISIENGVAGVAANVAKEADSVIRPEYNGVQIAQAIRSEESPETFSWRVHLASQQELVQVNPSQAEVVYTDGTEAFLITAEPAHDATGKPVPTSLAVNGNELTVKVEFRSGSYVYPIVAGEGWETSYEVPVIVEGPEDETQIREREERELIERLEREQHEREQGGEEGEFEGPEPSPPPNNQLSEAEGRRILQDRLIGNETIPAPEPSVVAGGGVATASSIIPEKVVKPVKTCEIDHCAIWRLEVRNPSYFYEKLYRDQNGNFYSSPGHGRVLVDAAIWRENTQVHCESHVGPLYAIAGVSVTHPEPWCGFAGQTAVSAGEHKHLTAWGRFEVNANVWVFIEELGLELFVVSRNYALQIWVWPNGFQQRVVRPWTDGIAEE